MRTVVVNGGSLLSVRFPTTIHRAAEVSVANSERCPVLILFTSKGALSELVLLCGKSLVFTTWRTELVGRRSPRTFATADKKVSRPWAWLGPPAAGV